jgi:hypothetical protein
MTDTIMKPIDRNTLMRGVYRYVRMHARVCGFVFTFLCVCVCVCVSDADKCMESGMTDTIMKPIGRNTLMRGVYRYVRFDVCVCVSLYLHFHVCVCVCVQMALNPRTSE